MPTISYFPGLWALLGIPAILAIHFLQRESRNVVTSTLFLLEHLAPKSAYGRRWQRLRTSMPLWLQLAAVLLLTWMLVQPRWLRSDTVQHVVIVLDSSVSMSAFHAELIENLERVTGRLTNTAARTEWQLLESDVSRPTLYSGSDRAALVRAAGSWKPHLMTHDFAPAWQTGQALLHGHGLLVFVSDRVCTAPEGVHLLTIGHPLENCGFCGATVDGRTWHTMVKNYGTTPQKRMWWIEANGQRAPGRELQLQPGQTATLSGEIPVPATSCQLFLDSDSFPMDDRLPIVLPEQKKLRIGIQANTPFTDFFSQLAGMIQAAEVSTEKPDIQFQAFDPSAPRLPETNAVILLSDPDPSREFLTGAVVSENHPLSRDLNWSGLLCRYSLSVPAKTGDEILVWQGERPLIFLRDNGNSSLLVANFDANASNATRLPAFILLMHRFVERVRAAKVGPESKNFDMNQPLSVAADPTLPPPVFLGQAGAAMAAPPEPGFFDVRQGDKVLLRGAAQFPDAREADFRDAGSVDHVHEAIDALMGQNSEPDAFAPLIACAVGAAMIASWLWRES